MLVAVLGTYMGPHHWARARALTERYEDCLFIELAGQEAQYPWVGAEKTRAVAHTCLFPNAVLERLDRKVIRQRLLEELDRVKPDAVFIPGYDRPYWRQAARWAKEHGVASVLCTDSWDYVLGRRRNPLKEFLKRRIVSKLYDGALAAGERSARYAWSLGLPYSRIWRGVDAIDNEHFASGAQAAREQDSRRRDLGLPQNYFLYVGRMIECKNIPTLVDAFQGYVQAGGTWDLVLVGDGPLCEAFRQRVASGPLDGRVQIRPWAAYDELPAYYGLARCAVLASLSETWGMVVNEAMAAGLPVLVSTQCGCMPELCVNGINGYVLDPGDAGQMARRMMWMSDGTADPAAMGEASRRIVVNWSCQEWVTSVLDCARSLRKERG